LLSECCPQSKRRRGTATLAEDAKRSCVVFPNEHCAGAAIDERKDESPNDRNDRAIRSAVAYLSAEIEGVVLVTDDAACLKLATEGGLAAASTKDFCDTSTRSADLKPLLAAASEDDGAAAAALKGGKDATKTAIYEKHLPMSELDAGVASGRFLKGVLRCSPRTCWRASVQTSDGLFFVDGADAVNRAVDGDVVVVGRREAPLPEEEEENKGDDDFSTEGRENESSSALDDDTTVKKEAPLVALAAAEDDDDDEEEATPQKKLYAKVVGIVRRNWRQRYCGSLVDDRFFVPVDRRLPKIRIPSRPPYVADDDRVAVALDEWPADSRLPRGHYVGRLGKAGDVAVETAMLLEEHDVATAEFTPQVLACLPPKGDYDFAGKAAAASAAGKRLDLRESLVVCSIDPPNCRDIDDALSCDVLEDGTWEVGIHIADVTHFCEPGTPLDVEASKRGTSTYLVDRRLDMLPKRLTEELCSLRAKVDRFAFSVFVTLDPKSGDVVVGETRFAKTFIRSKAALTYHEAQMMLNDDTDTSGESSESSSESSVQASVKRLAALARLLRKRRFARGALSLASPEVRFELSNESDSPTDVGAYKLVEANSTVEEFMLLANICVATKILEKYPGLALLRNHPEPPGDRFAPLIEKARIGLSGLTIDATSNKTLAKSLDDAAAFKEGADDPYVDRLLRIVATRCMAPARYFRSADVEEGEWRHYGLAARVYTHFTSPIRRYADVIVHRLLSAAIGLAPLTEEFAKDQKTISTMANHLNAKSKNAQYAARDSIALYTRLYFKDHPQTRVEARVFDVDAASKSVIVLVPRFGVEAKLRLSSDVDFPSPQTVVVDGQTYKVFDTLYVDVTVRPLQHDPLGEVRVVLSDDQQQHQRGETTTTATGAKKSSKKEEDIISPPPKKKTTTTTKPRKQQKGLAAAAAALGHLPIAPVDLGGSNGNGLPNGNDTGVGGAAPTNGDPPNRGGPAPSPAAATGDDVPAPSPSKRKLQLALERKKKTAKTRG